MHFVGISGYDPVYREITSVQHHQAKQFKKSCKLPRFYVKINIDSLLPFAGNHVQPANECGRGLGPFQRG